MRSGPLSVQEPPADITSTGNYTPGGWYLFGCFLSVFMLGVAAGGAMVRLCGT